jgi:8-amino-7-oxononanoate synthase
MSSGADNGSKKASDLATQVTMQAPTGAVPVLKRMIVRAVVNTRSAIGNAAQAVADYCAAGPSETIAPHARTPKSESFADLPAYRGIEKHRELGKLFGIKDPFYRVHDARIGAETTMNGRQYINFASYDYLGLNQHPAVAAAAKEAIERYGTSVSASRIVAGERALHGELESKLAAFYGVDAAIAFVSGHATNVSTIGTLMTPEDLIIYDELSHNSVLVGAKLSRATALSFRHNSLESLEKVLQDHRHLHKRALIVVEGLYSMDGDVADLKGLVALKEKYAAWLMVDEAHGLGVLGTTGRGIFELCGVEPGRVDVWMGTLSKTLAGCGGYIAGRQELIDVLKFQAPGLVYSVGLSPPLTAAASTALSLIKSEPERIERLHANGKLFLQLAKAAGLDTATSAGHAIVSIIVGDGINAVRLSERMLGRGLNVLPIIYPAVPLKAARLRFFITSEHTAAQIRTAVQVLREELDNLGRVRRAA